MPDNRLIRLPEVLEKVGVCRAKVYDMIKQGEFPKPRKIGRSSLWVNSEIDSWIDQTGTT